MRPRPQAQGSDFDARRSKGHSGASGEWLPHSPYATAGGRPGPVTFGKATIDLSPCRVFTGLARRSKISESNKDNDHRDVP